jgi:hypothetical protein
MQPSSTDKAKISFLLPDLERQLDPRNALRRLVGLLMLKSLRNLSDEEVVVFGGGLASLRSAGL